MHVTKLDTRVYRRIWGSGSRTIRIRPGPTGRYARDEARKERARRRTDGRADYFLTRQSRWYAVRFSFLVSRYDGFQITPLRRLSRIFRSSAANYKIDLSSERRRFRYIIWILRRKLRKKDIYWVRKKIIRSILGVLLVSSLCPVYRTLSRRFAFSPARVPFICFLHYVTHNLRFHQFQEFAVPTGERKV